MLLSISLCENIDLLQDDVEQNDYMLVRNLNMEECSQYFKILMAVNVGGRNKAKTITQREEGEEGQGE